MEHIPEEIIREWIEKAKPLVDSAWNLALDEAIRVVDTYSIDMNEVVVTEIKNSLSKLKKNIQ